MAKITTINDGEAGVSVRGKLNTAMASVETDATITGDGNVGTPLSVDSAQIDSSSIPNTPAGNIASTNVQDAINELDNEKQSNLANGTLSGTLLVDGQADAVQLTVQGNATQTSNVFVVENSAGTDLLSVDNTGNVVVAGTVDGRDLATDGTKLDGIEALADVTDATNVAAAGAVMDSELTNEAAVKAINQQLTTTSDVDFASMSLSKSGATTALDITQSGSGTSLNINNSGTGSFLVVNTNDFVIPNTGSITTDRDFTAANIITAGNVDGRDVSADGTTLDNLNASGLSALTTAEVDQLENIDTVTISNTQWGYLGATNQGLATTDNVTFADLTLSGNLTVNGTTTTINSTTMQVDDKNIELGTVDVPTDVTADGGGITLKGATDKTIIWDNANDNWTANQNWNLSTGLDYKINNVSVLNSTTLGSSVVNSSLTSVGTLSSLAVNGDLTVDTDTLYVDSANDRVGIGTTNPTDKLYVETSTDAGYGLTVANVSAGTEATTRVLLKNDIGALGGMLLQGSNRSGSYAGPNGLAIGTFQGGGADVAFVAGNTIMATMKAATGRLGLGTQDPQTNLHIETTEPATRYKSTSHANYWQITTRTDGSFDIGVNGADTNLKINATGQVGIGGVPTQNGFGVFNATGGQVRVYRDDATILLGEELGQVVFQGTQGAGLAGAAIRSEADENWAAGTNSGGKLIFRTTTNGATTPTDKMCIDNAGKVGIGTSSPAKMLSVLGDYRDTFGVYRNFDASGGAAGQVIQIGALDGTAQTAAGEIEVTSNFTGVNNQGSMSFNVLINGTMTKSLEINSSGFVGLGGIAPASALTLPSNSTISAGLTFGDGDTGIYEGSANQLRFHFGGTTRILTNTNIFAGNPSRTYHMTHGFAGSAVQPTYAFSDDIDTGMYSSVADTIQFATGGTERARLNSSGSLGIGTSSPNTRLEVSNTAQTLVAINNGNTLTNQSKLEFRSSTAVDAFIGQQANIGELTISSGRSAAWGGHIKFITDTVEHMRIKSSGVINLPTVPTYADDTAAGVGGLTVGDIYKTATGELRIKL